jgi:hypothetical protein
MDNLRDKFKKDYHIFYYSADGSHKEKKKAAWEAILKDTIFGPLKVEHDKWVKLHSPLGGFPPFTNAPEPVKIWHDCVSSMGGATGKSGRTKHHSQKKQDVLPSFDKPEVSVSDKTTMWARYQQAADVDGLFPSDRVVNALLGSSESIARSYRAKLIDLGYVFEQVEYGWKVTKPPVPEKMYSANEVDGMMKELSNRLTKEILQRFVNAR